MIVCKFGGTSLADAANIKKVAAVIKSDPKRKMVVVSAPGKRFSDDIKVTDLLYSLAASKSEKTKFAEILAELKSRFVQMIQELGVKGEDVLSALDIIAQEILQGVSQDFIASRGEYLNALLISEYMGFCFVDATEFIRLDADGGIDPLTYELGAKVLDVSKPTIVPGFYGLDKKGNIKTFSRGGSDISGAILAVCVKAEVYQNWTDVSGVMSADPDFVESPAFVPEITYAELRQMACFGTNVFHSEAIAPVAKAGISIQVKNTLKPEDAGTTISCSRFVDKMPVVAVSGIRGLRKITIRKENLNQKQLTQAILQMNELGFKSLFSRFAADFAYIYGNYETETVPEAIECDLSLSDKKYTVLGLVGQGLDWEKVLHFMSELQGVPVVDFSYEKSSNTVAVVVEDSDFKKALQIISSKIK